MGIFGRLIPLPSEISAGCGLSWKTKPEEKEKYDKLRNRLDHLNFTRLATTAAGGLVGGAVRGMTSGYKSGSSGKMNVLKNVKDGI